MGMEFSQVLGEVCWTMNSQSSTAFTPSRLFQIHLLPIYKRQALVSNTWQSCKGPPDQAFYIPVQISLSRLYSWWKNPANHVLHPRCLCRMQAAIGQSWPGSAPHEGIRDQLRSANRNINKSKQVNKVIATSAVQALIFLLYWAPWGTYYLSCSCFIPFHIGEVGGLLPLPYHFMIQNPRSQNWSWAFLPYLPFSGTIADQSLFQPKSGRYPSNASFSVPHRS